MLQIIKNEKSLSFINGANKNERPFNTVDYNIVNGDTVIFQHVNTRTTLLSEKIENIEVDGVQLTAENVDEKLQDILFF
ncbi:hypothetical protein GGR21_002913 [Dysgonomonas hofstadii]|uniref:Uncharacterized protein n=1 Tax=Dysgonomonas hofstadii TaxID=637886 RepID=A0A840CQP7_9BACT|nr:hypothetical protein [Dysgonomonas hofstadii]MBB4036999.1 hypothetical protein [Dysgonomonas hofstadii]